MANVLREREAAILQDLGFSLGRCGAAFAWMSNI